MKKWFTKKKEEQNIPKGYYAIRNSKEFMEVFSSHLRFEKNKVILAVIVLLFVFIIFQLGFGAYIIKNKSEWNGVGQIASKLEFDKIYPGFSKQPLDESEKKAVVSTLKFWFPTMSVEFNSAAKLSISTTDFASSENIKAVIAELMLLHPDWVFSASSYCRSRELEACEKGMKPGLATIILSVEKVVQI